jgi:hypothetical protein
MSAVMPSLPRADAGARVSVCAAGRIHLGFLDPSGTLGRRFGSLGLVVERFQTEVSIAPAARDTWQADSAAAEAQLERAVAHVQRLDAAAPGHERAAGVEVARLRRLVHGTARRQEQQPLAAAVEGDQRVVQVEQRQAPVALRHGH